jgi:hypothetical protein
MKDTAKLVMIAVRENGMALQFASLNVRSDYKVALTSIKQNPLALQFYPLSDENISDVDRKSCVMEAIMQKGLTLQYA